MKKFIRSETVKNLLWIAFGVIGGINYFSREEYWISGIHFLVAVLYAYNLGKHLIFSHRKMVKKKD